MKRLIHEGLKSAIKWAGRRARINFLELAYDQLGILKYEDEVRSGEAHFFENFLPRFVSGNPVVFDVGANLGDYSALALKQFPGGQIFAFEPSARAADQIRKRFSGKVECVQAAVQSESGTAVLYNYRSDPASSHGSTFREVFDEIHGAADVGEEQCSAITLDEFCRERQLERVHLLKIDTEGGELGVLRGARSLLKEGRIDMIQFEFNEMNVISRVFLRDFYQVLANYRLFRLDTGRVIPLGAYDARNEIFKFQNIVAVRSALPGSNH